MHDDDCAASRRYRAIIIMQHREGNDGSNNGEGVYYGK
jgi:hypothetical protein